MSCFEHDQSRRAFLKRSAALGLAGVATPFVTSLGAIGEAAAATATDYKAMVCIFLYGGNDYANTLTPYDQPSYDRYLAARSNIAHGRDSLAATLLKPSQALADGRQYALAPTMRSLLSLFDGGRLAPILNVGTLVQPTTKAQYQANAVRLPPKLFSHNDQLHPLGRRGARTRAGGPRAGRCGGWAVACHGARHTEPDGRRRCAK